MMAGIFWLPESKVIYVIKTSTTRYCGTYGMKIVLRFIENLSKNESFPLRQLSLKQCFWLHSLLC